MKSIVERVAALREKMQQYQLEAYIVPSTDPHASEYMADHWKEVMWLSGFKGEAGTILVTQDEAYLWTDSRYYLQANKELANTGISLMRESDVDCPSIAQWLCANMAKDSHVGVNPEMFTVKQYNALASELGEAEISLKSIDLIKPLWTENRPSIPQYEMYEYSSVYAGETVNEKLARVREQLGKKYANTMVVSALDEIAWLLNIRGKDVEFNPVVISYVLIEEKSCTLFVDPQKLTTEVTAYLSEAGVKTMNYEEVYAVLNTLTPQHKVLYDASKLNQALYEAIPSHCKTIDAQSPILLIKSIKNAVELEGERIAMRKDAVALTRFFMWLEQEAFAKGQTQTEYTLMQKLHEYRAEQENFVDESFGTIAGYQGNGAIVHYEATEANCSTVENKGMLLLDSGGQYLDGTTDITRTLWLGEVPQPTDEMYDEYMKARHDNTLVLKGHIALATAKFPKGTRGNQLDVLAHQYMWQEGITYGHGTGHGVGHFLCCHEGPQNIRTDNNPSPLHVGNICSDEPGIYRTDEYGIRIENLIAVTPAEKTDFGEYYCFETLTLCYYDHKLIDESMLTKAEKEWLNEYQDRLLKVVEPYLGKEEMEWLRGKSEKV